MKEVRSIGNGLGTRVSVLVLLLGGIVAGLIITASTAQAAVITARVVAIDQVLVYNRLGAFNPAGMIYALRRDVVDANTGLTEAEGGLLLPGQVRLREDKRPRPIVLRANEGDTLQVIFQNLLNPVDITDADNEASGVGIPANVDPLTGQIDNPRGQSEQPVTRAVGIHVHGMQLAFNITDDGSNVGRNPNSLVAPGGQRVYSFYADKEGVYMLNSTGVNLGAEGNSGTQSAGLFGAVNVEPQGSSWYRSQVTRTELEMATRTNPDGSRQMTPDGHPIINYKAVYPQGHRFAGLPILNLLHGNEIVHSDLNAVISGGAKSPQVPAYPNRTQPFREFTVVFHDEIKSVQAFPGYFSDDAMSFTLHSVRDSFAINYGTGGVGAEIIANRLGVGPMHDCYECKYEEFFLTSWAVGDPAMIVDVPANIGLENLTPGQVPDANFIGPKATKAFYPDDPANVWHSYLNDRVKIRNVHVGSEQHLFHLHAHQWLFSPDAKNSTYLDSQALAPGSAYTYEIAYNGSGNRNKTSGDSIFHCHFYPHFAQGMWGLWRVHDVFEDGSLLDANGLPVPGTRALPDGEISAGTPIPAVVPMPGLAMAPLPQADVTIVNGQPIVTPHPNTTGNPGYPFFIPGIAGHRPPTPPLDLIQDGGLPRHIITAGSGVSEETPLSFDKTITAASAVQLPEGGTEVELAAMNFHATLFHDSYKPNGLPATGTNGFETNGLPPVPGAPFANPCRSDGTSYYNGAKGTSVGNPRAYSAAVIELDVQFNKVGWHFNQQRILTLEEDVADTLNGLRPPEPLVLRGNTNDCIDFDHTNLVPNIYQQDDFQVKTPTDVIGQHIHLVKFDVTASDGSGNGWNYEDGTFSGDEVVERIHALNDPLGGGLLELDGTTINQSLSPVTNLGVAGARTTRQRWYIDPLQNLQLKDRGLGAVFTHDHFGPSTHQQAGLYATLIIEPEGSTWRDSETGVTFGSRSDGGPTSWRADILNGNESFREFYLEFGDFQLAYTASGEPINPPGREAIGTPFLIERACPPPFPLNGPCPEAISADDVGTFVVNYRNEPLALRVRDPLTNSQAAGQAGDLSYAFSSKVPRADPLLNTQPSIYPPLTSGLRGLDPFTPMLKVYEGDDVRMRVQVGSTEELHPAGMHGVKWLQEPRWADSGYRNSQTMGISEKFSWEFPVVVDNKNETDGSADFLYAMDASSDGYWNGIWGIMRAYQRQRGNLLPLPNNPIPTTGQTIVNAGKYRDICPKAAPKRSYDITAVSVNKALSSGPGLNDGTLVYNTRAVNGGPLQDPTGIMYVHTGDLDIDGRLLPGVPTEPLILRAAAGECIEVTLRNQLPPDDASGFSTVPDMDGFNMMPMMIENFNANQVKPSSSVGLHPQLVSYSIRKSDGANVGVNPVQTVSPGSLRKYRWYAGDVKFIKQLDGTVRLTHKPMEYGAVNLISSDRIKHSNKGAIGALVIEPQGSSWQTDPGTRASATVTKSDASTFREFVVIIQDDVNLRLANNSPIPAVGGEGEDAEDSGHGAINYRSEPAWFRLGYSPDLTPEALRTVDFSNLLANSQVGGDPETPVFNANAGEEIRFRLVQPGGHPRTHAFALHGHLWPQFPYTNNGSEIGPNLRSFMRAEQLGPNPGGHYDIVPLHGAGGINGIPGDYLYRDMLPIHFANGIWGILRVN